MKLIPFLTLTLTVFAQSFFSSNAQIPKSGKKPSQQVIIFKFDDLSERTEMAFQRVADIIVNKECKAGFGIVGRSCEGGTEKMQYFNRVKDFNNTGRIEIWAHGYDHFMNGDTLTEFRNSSYEKQFDHFKKTLDLVSEKCGITMHTFGTPGNKADSSTTRVINQFPQVQVYLFPFLRDPVLKQLLLTSRVDMEQGTGKMNYDFFVKNYNSNSDRKYMVLQGHPGVWKEDGFETLSKIIDFLKTKEVLFMTPFEYYTFLKPL
jgi:peptidoglycan/xylan/chitin deacetylase (PgdA/CDA1 family)